MRAVVLLLVGVVGCSGSTGQTPSSPSGVRVAPGPAATRTPATQPATPQPVAPKPIVRTLDDSAAKELGEAFAANPVAAKRKYAGVRWRFSKFSVTGFAGDDPVINSPWGFVSLDFRDRADIGRLEQGPHFTADVTVDDFRYASGGGVIRFTDAVLVR